METAQVVVVGAGIAGLTAAFFLQQAGYHPVVIEKSGRVGGRMITDHVDGFTIDCGAQFLMDSYTILNDLVARNGLYSNTVLTSEYLGTYRNGKFHKTTSSNPLSLLSSGTLGFSAWLRFLSGSLRLMGPTNPLPGNDYTAWTKYDDLDSETWSNGYFGKEVSDYLSGPIMDGLFFQSLGEISRAFVIAMLSGFLYRKAKHTTALTGGIGTLPECLASQFEVRLSTPVLGISAGKSGVELDTSAGPISAERVILACPVPAAQAIYSDGGPAEHELLKTTYSSTLVIAVGLDEFFHLDPKLEDIYGFMIPRVERESIASISNEKKKDRLRVAKGELFSIFLAGAAGKKMIDWEEEAILPVVLKEMDRYLPGVSGHIQFRKIYRWREAMPMSPVGRSKHVARYRLTLDPSNRVILAGDYMGMAFTEGAAETGKWAAEAVMRSLIHKS